jgi:AraC-like DNA-binding protein
MWFGDYTFILSLYKILCLKQKMDTEIRLIDILHDLGMAERDFYRQIQRITGVTPRQFINITRFYGAKEMLLFDYEIEDIMLRIRVDSESYFYHRFKEFHNSSPQGLKMKTNSDDQIYKNLISRTDHTLLKLYSEKLKIALKNYYTRLLDKNLADFMANDEFRGIFIDTYLDKVKIINNY